MRSSSPFIPKRLTSSLNLQSQTKQYQTNKSFPYNIQSFNFDIPNSTLRIPNKPSQASFASEAPFKTNPQIHFDDSRREQIKQKIKFRVKQEMWNFMKKNFENLIIQQVPAVAETQRVFNIQSSRGYVKGGSFTRIHQQDFSFGNSQVSQAKKFSKGYDTHGCKTKQSDKVSHGKQKRLWSSLVRIKQKDRVEMRKSCYKASSTANIQKLDSYKIEPWKSFEDAQNLIVDR